jgi:calcineurin-like phosphoesterase family protein
VHDQRPALRGDLPVNLFAFSDPHFGQERAITWPGRTHFQSVEEMDQTMIDNWNRVVRPNDWVIVIGDVAMNPKHAKRVVPQLTGLKILIGGNHDEKPSTFYHEAGFFSVYGCRVINDMICTHIPIAPWSLNRWRANIHGHVHASCPKVYRKLDPVTYLERFAYVNVSAEVVGFTPVSIEEINTWIR